MRNIILIGFMGCGKSTVGRILHNRIGYTHLDTDELIEISAGKSITEIFQSDGETSFRDMETQLLHKLILEGCDCSIISTGGGMAVREENQELLRKLGFVVWLSCSPKNIHARTSRNKDRPLLNCNDPMNAITSLLEERTPMYEKASHLKINTDELDFDEIACGILESARYHYGNMG